MASGYDGTTIPVRLRAIDFAGNMRTEILPLSIDTAPPTLVGPYTYNNHPYDSYVQNDDIIITYPPLLDASGWVTTAAVIIDDNGDALDWSMDGRTTITRITSEGVPIAANVGVMDEVGNLVYDELGDWYNEGSSMSVQPEGIMEINRSEWLSTTEYLDSDYRADQPQSLWVTWDIERIGIGWQGAVWGADGALWLYIDTLDGGATQPVSGTGTLPFSADFAVNAISPEVAYLYRSDGGAWNFEREMYLPTAESLALGFAEYGHDPAIGVTEIIVPDLFGDDYMQLNDFPHHRLLAYASDANGDIWSAFPTSNALDGNFAHYFAWDDITRIFPPVHGQYNFAWSLPVGARQPYIAADVTADPSPQEMVSASETITYQIELTNLDEIDSASSLVLTVSAPSGVTFQSVSPANDVDCSAETTCTATLSDIATGASEQIAVTAVLDDDLSALPSITTDITIESADGMSLAHEAVTHETDSVLPVATLIQRPGRVIGSGLQTLNGSADDSGGSGIAAVEVSTDGNSWQTADGTEVWTAEVNITGNTRAAEQTVYVRAIDQNGQVGFTEAVTLAIDTTAPQITPTMPTLVGGSGSALLLGTTSDPAPADAEVESVIVQINGGDAAQVSEPTDEVVTTEPTAQNEVAPTQVAALTENQRQCVETYDPAADYFPEKVEAQYTAQWSVVYHNHYKVITLDSTYDDPAVDPVLEQYVLVQCGTPIPDEFVDAADTLVIEVPVQRMVEAGGGVLGAVEMLDLLDPLIAWRDQFTTGVQHLPKVSAKYAAGDLGNIGEYSSGWEATLDFEPDLLIAYDDREGIEEARGLGIPYVFFSPFAEEPLESRARHTANHGRSGG